ncbi:expansin EXLX1 family cellulose-binding protein [Actinocorallia longicatena]|uniref:Expansin EXLX1 family cellulose-binding protein n=1 Tax=Actinocorallia longicatena TaxID=111803 RepID=A0ABP6QAG0_9ACTN
MLGSVAGAAVALLAVAAFTRPTPACALSPSLELVPVKGRSIPSPSTGWATHYAASGGNCTYPALPADRYVAALSPAEYRGAAACGTYLDLRGPHGTVRVEVVDQCVKCKPGELDLSDEAFARLAPMKSGRVPITYTPVTDPAVPPLAVRVRGGSNPYWLSLLVMNHGNALAGVRARAKGRPWTSLRLSTYNAWQAPEGLGPGPFTVEVTDVRGHKATVRGIRLVIDLVQKTEVSLYRRGGTPPAAPTPQSGPAETVLPRAAGGTPCE